MSLIKNLKIPGLILAGILTIGPALNYISYGHVRNENSQQLRHSDVTGLHSNVTVHIKKEDNGYIDILFGNILPWKEIYSFRDFNKNGEVDFVFLGPNTKYNQSNLKLTYSRDEDLDKQQKLFEIGDKSLTQILKEYSLQHYIKQNSQ